MLKAAFDDVLVRTFAGFGDQLAQVGPRLLAMLVLLAAGVALGGLTRYLVPLLLGLIRFDRFAARAGVTVVLRRGGIDRSPSAVVATLTAWTVLGLFVLLAVAALDLQIAVDLLSRALLYLPQVLVAAAILVLGTLAAAFLRRSVLIASVNAGLVSGRLIAGGVHTAVVALVVAMALEHLGVGPHVILATFVVVLSGVVLALALAFGLAGRDLARQALERLFQGRAASPETDDPRRHL